MALSKRLAIIAGGFGGLGTATANSLREQGAELALLYAPFEASRKAEVEQTYGDTATTYECDITDPASVDAAFKLIANSEAFPCILVNAAGYVSIAPLEETTSEDAIKTIHSNLLGPMFVSQAFARLYREKKQASKDSAPPGRIISISSQAAHVALYGHGPYCASKAGLIGLTKCMASEWGPWGITANTVSPTVVLTELGKKAWSDEKKRNAHLAEIPTGRFALPEEVAQAVAYLCRDESGMVNGADLRIDGGFTIR